MDTSGFTVEEAAYLMGLSVEKIRKMIDRGELLTISATGKIHETEMYRFQHPWKRVFALDQRCTAQ
jgi:excisionase family DNA binding protein